MSDQDGAAIDPRYDPAFQRGFSGEVQTGAHGQSALRRTAAVNPSSVRPAPERTDPSRPEDLRNTTQPAETASAGSVSTSTPPAAGDVGGSAPADNPARALPHVAAEAEVGPRELARNPFVIALAALAALLILVGIVWAYSGFASIASNGGTRNEVEFWAAQTMSFGAPLAIVAGLAVVAVVLVLFGRSWRRPE